MTTAILIVDDSGVMRDTLRRMLAGRPEFAVVGEAASGPEAIALSERLLPNVAIVDIGMQGMNGLEATVEILRRSPQTAVIILTVYKFEQYVVRALKAGARGYLLKESLDEDELLRAIRTVLDGGRFLTPAIAGAAQ